MCVVVPCGVDYKRVVANRRTSARTSSARPSPMRSRQPPSSRLGARVKIRRRERAVSVSVASNSTEAESGRGRTGTRDERFGSPRLSVRFDLVSRSGSTSSLGPVRPLSSALRLGYPSRRLHPRTSPWDPFPPPAAASSIASSIPSKERRFPSRDCVRMASSASSSMSSTSRNMLLASIGASNLASSNPLDSTMFCSELERLRLSPRGRG